MILSLLRKQIFPYLPSAVAASLELLPANFTEQVMEIRLRANQPVTIVLTQHDLWMTAAGQPTEVLREAVTCNKEDILRSLQIMSRNSVYAMEKELQQGFLTLAGGHRVGLSGQAIVEEGKVKALKNISSLNIRIAREVKGSANDIMPYLMQGSWVVNTLIISPPRCGKTTLLRDIARQLSQGLPEAKFPGVQVGIVDERSEIAACIDGVPSMDMGARTDVLDGCPKAQGMLMLIRSMAPSVIITDELGRKEDVEAVQEALNAGVAVIASIHGSGIADILGRPYAGRLLANNWFKRYVILGSRPYPGTIEEIRTGIDTANIIFHRNRM